MYIKGKARIYATINADCELRIVTRAVLRSITSLGDTLWNRGLLYASQFCYLLANGAKEVVTNLIWAESDDFISRIQFAAKFYLLPRN